MRLISIIFTSLIGFMTPGLALGDTYETANFGFGIFGGDANQSSPFAGVVASWPSGGAFTGSLVIDDNLLPGPTSGYVNVFFYQYPDIAWIPPATALNIPLGSLPPFTLADAVGTGFAQEAAAQFYNGQFAGLFYISDFTYGGSPFELQIQGGSLSIYQLVGGVPTGSSLANGYVDWGLSNRAPYTPPTPTVPEPSTWVLLTIGLAATGAVRALRRTRARPGAA